MTWTGRGSRDTGTNGFQDAATLTSDSTFAEETGRGRSTSRRRDARLETKLSLH